MPGGRVRQRAQPFFEDLSSVRSIALKDADFGGERWFASDINIRSYSRRQAIRPKIRSDDGGSCMCVMNWCDIYNKDTSSSTT
jgi:hypothetical protein